MTVEECKHTIERMEEVNPMLGLRGCRLGIVLPELVEMQVRALVEASLNNKYKKGLNPVPEIMIPLIGYSLTHSLTHSHLLTYLLTYSLTHSLTHSLTYLLI
jgi:phosphoenolpyruvate synthase/pyruvate phosphate dikinase